MEKESGRGSRAVTRGLWAPGQQIIIGTPLFPSHTSTTLFCADFLVRCHRDKPINADDFYQSDVNMKNMFKRLLFWALDFQRKLFCETEQKLLNSKNSF